MIDGRPPASPDQDAAPIWSPDFWRTAFTASSGASNRRPGRIATTPAHGRGTARRHDLDPRLGRMLHQLHRRDAFARAEQVHRVVPDLSPLQPAKRAWCPRGASDRRRGRRRTSRRQPPSSSWGEMRWWSWSIAPSGRSGREGQYGENCTTSPSRTRAPRTSRTRADHTASPGSAISSGTSRIASAPARKPTSAATDFPVPRLPSPVACSLFLVPCSLFPILPPNRRCKTNHAATPNNPTAVSTAPVRSPGAR